MVACAVVLRYWQTFRKEVWICVQNAVPVSRTLPKSYARLILRTIGRFSTIPSLDPSISTGSNLVLDDVRLCLLLYQIRSNGFFLKTLIVAKDGFVLSNRVAWTPSVWMFLLYEFNSFVQGVGLVGQIGDSGCR